MPVDKPPLICGSSARTMKFTMNARVSASAGVLIRELEGEAVLLNLNNESYYGLDAIGTRMLAVLTAAESVQAAYEQLLGEYEVEPERLMADLDVLIEKLVAQGLLDVAGG